MNAKPTVSLVRLLAAFALAFAIPVNAHASDVTLSAGAGGNHTRLMRLSVHGESSVGFTEGGWRLDRYWEGGFGRWHTESAPASDDPLWEVWAAPVFQLSRIRGPGAKAYVEGAIGLHLLSETEIDERDLSSHYQFGTHIAAGFHFGSDRKLELGLRLQHLSNASLVPPNRGINFAILYLSRPL